MSEIAIRVEHLSKQYRIGERESYKALRDVITDAAASPFRRMRAAFNGNGASENGSGSSLITNHSSPNSGNSIWALDDVSFEVKRGEVAGFIGRNGAGKSTLLKILSRITKPTKGHAKIFGRVGSLLEVGTGFHPELTGRENVYLNGAILGMRKAEIERKFDEIVAFAEVEKFIDTPVKRYSSGMYVRLAFAVAAHMETEVLIVDEVLAVGDREFQKKCLGKLDDVSHHGRTVLLVSHQMNQIRNLCTKALWLDEGTVRSIGKAADVIADYEKAPSKTNQTRSTGRSAFLRWSFDGTGNTVKDGLRPLTLRLVLNVAKNLNKGHLGVRIVDERNVLVASWGFDEFSLQPGVTEIVLELPSLPLRPGVYSLSCSLFNNGNNVSGGEVMEVWHATPNLVVEASELAHPQNEWLGLLNLPAKMTTESRPRS